jgi:flagellar assembly protein FliH
MDAEIRRLTYIPRFAAGKPGIGSMGGLGSLMGELPPLLRKDLTSPHTAKQAELRLETQIIELERGRAESERHHREAIAAFQQKAAEELAGALQEQKETLDQQWASSIRTAIAAFQEAQAQYFAEAEAAVVRLALGIAARVLHREAQMDPLLLRGPVRVALEDAQQNASCVLEVAADMTEAWQHWFSNGGTTAPRVQIKGKEDAAVGHCRLEIGASTADLSVDAQLSEIERGFFDLLQRRPMPVGEAAE